MSRSRVLVPRRAQLRARHRAQLQIDPRRGSLLENYGCLLAFWSVHSRSLETTYEAVRTFQILGVEKDKGLIGKACKFAAEKLASSSSSPAKDLFHAARISGVLKCSVDSGVYDVGLSLA